MIPVGTIINDISLAMAIIRKIKADIPLLQKTVADVQQAVKDGKNLTALTNDLGVVLNDLLTDMNALAALFPPPPPPPTQPAAA